MAASSDEEYDLSDTYSSDPTLNYISTLRGKFSYFPVDDHPLLPGYVRMIPISRKLEQSLNEPSTTRKIVVSTLKNPENIQGIKANISSNQFSNFVPEIKDQSEVSKYGCICEVNTKEQTDFGTIAIIKPVSLCKIENFLSIGSPLGQVEAMIYKEAQLTENDVDMETAVKYQYLKNLMNQAVSVAKDENFKRLLISLTKTYDPELIHNMVYMCISCLALPKVFHKYGFLLLHYKGEDLHKVIHTLDVKQKVEKTLKLFSEFTNKIELWERLEDDFDINREKSKATEKLQSIYDSLKKMFEQGKDEQNVFVEKILKALEGKEVPAHIQEIIESEVERFKSMDKHAMEANIIRNYLETLAGLPFGVRTEENLNIQKAKAILDESHYGMQELKTRILECIAVGQLKGTIQGKILCFVGPPGVGKTSIGESVAKALNRKFKRISLGGDRDTSSLKGFRRTYVGAVPGKVVKALKDAGSENPVILLDEIDKLAERSSQGDPSSVLLEILDPEQNHSFTDDFLDTPIDLSKVFFLCTANDLGPIRGPLTDRMEIIEVAGYTFEEKLHIYRQYLKPTAIEKSGIKPEHNWNIADGTIEKLVLDYCRESGMRSLQRYTNRIFDKIAYKIAEGADNIQINRECLREFIGPAHFSSKRLHRNIPVGVSIGLGFNNLGGTIMYIEASKSDFKKGGSFKVTGNVGKVMDESTQIALTFAKNFLNLSNPEKAEKLSEMALHVHFTEGAVSKDGPSAGISICTALLSLALERPIVENLGMTGELSLTGKVLPIGGVKEKTMAAKREGVNKLIFPAKNKEDVLDLPENIREGIDFHFAEDYKEVFAICFPNK